MQSNWTNKPQDKKRTIADEKRDTLRISLTLCPGIKDKNIKLIQSKEKIDVNNIV